MHDVLILADSHHFPPSIVMLTAYAHLSKALAARSAATSVPHPVDRLEMKSTSKLKSMRFNMMGDLGYMPTPYLLRLKNGLLDRRSAFVRCFCFMAAVTLASLSLAL